VNSFATFRFYAELNQFLLPEHRQQTIYYTLPARTSVKHPIEAYGVPHTEVELLLINGAPQSFDAILQRGDRVAVFPAFRYLAPDGAELLRPPLSRPIRFLLDVHLGQLATYLRLLGFDAAYQNDWDDPELAEMAAREQLVLLTRDRRLLMRSAVVYGYCLHSRNPEEQLLAVLQRYSLFEQIAAGSRCLRCNGLLAPVAKGEIIHRLEPKTRRYYDDFFRCLSCDQIYWQGSHYERMQTFVSAVRRIGEANGSPLTPSTSAASSRSTS
jgi:uncharacterized protein with PIN domain